MIITSHPAHVVTFSMSAQIVLAVSLLLGTAALTSRASADPRLNKDAMFMMSMEI
jgi:hypothetical protein